MIYLRVLVFQLLLEGSLRLHVLLLNFVLPLPQPLMQLGHLLCLPLRLVQLAHDPLRLLCQFPISILRRFLPF